MNITTAVPRHGRATHAVSVTLEEGQDGQALVLLNGEPALAITASGYLRRLRGLSEEAGVRRLPDGRIAIKPRHA